MYSLVYKYIYGVVGEITQDGTDHTGINTIDQCDHIECHYGHSVRCVYTIECA